MLKSLGFLPREEGVFLPEATRITSGAANNSPAGWSLLLAALKRPLAALQPSAVGDIENFEFPGALGDTDRYGVADGFPEQRPCDR
jgi:hypothetical protein